MLAERPRPQIVAHKIVVMAEGWHAAFGRENCCYPPSSARWGRGNENTHVSAVHIARHLVGIQKMPVLKQLVLGQSKVRSTGRRHES